MDITSNPRLAKFLPPNAKVVLQIGGFNVNQGNNQHINIATLIGDQFTVTKANDQNALFGIGYFIPTFNFNYAQLMLGVNAFYFFPTEVHGKVIQENLFQNLSYQYTVTHLPIYAALRGIINTSNCYKMVIDLGVGPNIIQANQFSEASLDGITLPDDPFRSQTNVVLSATAGLGIQFVNLLKQASVELNYRFYYLGEGQLQKISPVLNNLSTGNAIANALILTIAF